MTGPAFPSVNDNMTPSLSSRKSQSARVLRAEFGDGYNQRATDGINNVRGEFNNIWRGIPNADADIIINFLIDHAGANSFTWTDPTTSLTIDITCEEWTRTPLSLNYQTVTAVFREVFDL